MSRFSQEELEDLKKNIDLVALVRAKGVDLKPRGKDLFGLCPFHNDREASLVVTPSKNVWNCLGCQEGGDVIQWVMKAEGVSFRHAVELLRDGHASRIVTSGKVTGKSTVPRLPAPVDPSKDDQLLLQQVVNYYHERLKQSPAALTYLEKRGIRNEEALLKFKLGFSDRTLGLRLPQKNRKEGAEVRSRLEKIGIYRGSGHEHFNGSIVIPVLDENGIITEIYGRKINDNLRPGTPYHLYLPGPHKGIWNPESLNTGEVILCESLIDALTFWVNGFRNVTASYGIQGFTEDHLSGLLAHQVKRVYLAYDRDEAGDKAAEKLAEKLISEGIECYRVQFPHQTDANSYACQASEPGSSLGHLIRAAAWMGQHGRSQPSMEERTEQASDSILSSTLAAPASPPAAKEEKIEPSKARNRVNVPVTVKGDDIAITLGDREYRIRGLSKNLSFEIMKVNVRVSIGDRYHIDTLDLYNARHRTAFINTAAEEIGIKSDVIKRDIGRVLLKLEELQEQHINEALNPAKKEITLTDKEREEALELLRDPNLLDRIVSDFEKCGLVGERTNVLVGYLSAISRKFEKPLAIMIQSSTAAGKSTLMDAILNFIPEEDKVKYTAMTGQSLFYMGETELSHRTLAISEEEGAERAKYAIKTMQSETNLRIASTGKDPKTGRLVTHEYEVKGPIQVMFTTTSVELDEELQNRCIVLTVNEDREQTRAIHRMQREAETLEGQRRNRERERILKLHQNAQRLLKPITTDNGYATRLTFLDNQLRTRRDHEKYLVLIRSLCLLRQYQRPVKTDRGGADPFDYVQVTLEDIETANRLANEVLGRTLDELSPQTRRLLMLIDEMITDACDRMEVDRADYRFSRKDVRQYTGWTDFQVKVHMRKLEEMEYLLVHRGGRGQSFVYELLYNGEGQNGSSFLMGLIDTDKLRCMYDEKKEHENRDLEHSKAEKEPSSSIQVAPKEPPSSMPKLRSIHVPSNGNGRKKHIIGSKDFWPSYAHARHNNNFLAAKVGGGVG